ncbi:nitrous oxide reductase family maturation protein NosD [Nitratiruptor tergarcus]|uniref:Nitrous oxidase accessory protein n=1 Tax=Nitratiruptor tergarcus DSM 16512 TaxID=1069081 RepID=A0A1W1WSA2_9BACT|nr:nitrous oxide reductase family maturation protein NosD [Nitratiruptor tergarcus]SMC08593.1 nitrous oxidase accessory protein [Nitratiruptor tergarcus DSM 16512]
MRRVALLVCIGAVLHANILQEAINKAKPGARLDLPKGVLKGSITINKPLMLVGHDTIIDGEGKGTVIKVRSSNVILQDLTIRNSGKEHEKVDAGISVKDAAFVQIRNCKILNSLFGIDLQNVKNSKIIGNYITSKPFPLGIRGDGVRLWYSNDNVLKNNHLYKSRDFVVWYSHGNLIEGNIGEYGRYSLHFMYAGKNIVRKNIYKHNSVGIFFMYSRDTIAENNIVMSSLGTTGMGIGLKDASNFVIKNNTILYCAKGMYIDRSPFEPGQSNKIVGNKILYNSIGMHFHSLSTDNVITKNIFKGNMENVYDDSGQGRIHAVMNKWYENYWDDYQGIDKDGDGIGDIPYTLYYYADKLWLLNPNVRFFYASPVISILNFLYKLAPISEPIKLLSDPKPLMYEEGVS